MQDMSDDKGKPAYPQAGKDYETAVLEFLDKEISASTKPAPGSNAQEEEVDALVSDLLRLAIAVTDEPEAPQENKAEDLDSLFADILSSSSVASVPGARPLETEPKPSQPKQDPMNQASPIRTVEAEPKREGVVQPPIETGSGASAAGRRDLPVPPDKVSGTDRPDPRAQAPAPQAVPAREEVAIFTVAARGPVRRRRVLVVFAELACLLGIIGAGAWYFPGFRHAALSQSGEPASMPAQVAPVATSPAKPQKITRAAPAKAPLAQLSDPTAGRSTSRSNARQAGLVPGPARRASAAAARWSNSPSPPAPAAEAAVHGSSNEKAGSPEGTGAGSPKLNPPSHAVEIDAPPATIIAQAPQGQIQARPAPAALPSLDEVGLPPRSSGRQSAAKAPASAVLISQVQPVYPEVARRMHLTGTVRIEILIDEQGKVIQATPLSGPSILRSAAVDAVLRWRYRPATLGNSAIRSQGQVSIVFNNP